MSPKKATPAPTRTSEGLELYEKAMKAFGKKDYERARELLLSLLDEHPDERDVIDRARTYLLLAERALEKRPAFRPKAFEDLLHYGVYLHNRGEFDEALKLFHQAAEIHPRNEHLLYCMAAAAARAGDSAAAVKALKSAIAANPANRAQARMDSDFDPLRDDDDFAGLLAGDEA